MGEMVLYNCEKRLLSSLYLFDCLTTSIAPISRIAVKGHIGDFSENLLGRPSLVKMGPKLSRNLLEDLSVLQCIRRHYIAIYMRYLPDQLNQIVSVAEEV
jgi:hypothetical protein